MCVGGRGLRLLGGWGDEVSGVAGVLIELMDLARRLRHLMYWRRVCVCVCACACPCACVCVRMGCCE